MNPATLAHPMENNNGYFMAPPNQAFHTETPCLLTHMACVPLLFVLNWAAISYFSNVGGRGHRRVAATPHLLGVLHLFGRGGPPIIAI